MLVGKILKKTFLSLRNEAAMSTTTRRCLYQTLGVKKGTPPNQLKKAYYKLAQELHPDKNPNPNAKDKFAQINNAYEVLSDDLKRKAYDQTGRTGDQQYDEDFEDEQDIFTQFKKAGYPGRKTKKGFSSMEDFQAMFEDLFENGKGRKGKNKGMKSQSEQFEDINMKLDIQFSQSVTGTSKKVELKRKCTCSVCHGSRTKPGSKPQTCQNCEGHGVNIFKQGSMVFQMPCETCQGSGKVIIHPCTHCSGSGVQSIKKTEEIKIPQGIQNGASIKVRGKGNMGGDLNIKVNVKPHPNLIRQGLDAIEEREISIVDAVLGCMAEVQTIHGRKREIKIPSGAQNGQQIKIQKQGFNKLNSNDRGCHILKIKIKIPTKISNQERVLYMKLKSGSVA